ncbi:kinase-like protein [Gigaspora margarita]|uniref:Kinase-like protein n=1 Tax=Gigaspora margarita TaxID=4874 RepID=A0A8H4AZ05_GIGMA|nr:kinase-like protein [Gigaspora margarita]
MENIPEEWLERAISDGHINYLGYNKFTVPTIIGIGDKLRIAKEIVLDLLFLHNNDVIHRDLHSKNILIHNGQPQIADFGLSKQIKETSTTSCSKIHGMLAYIESKRGYKRDKKSDIYSLGVILWEISSGRSPYQTFESEFSIIIHISEGKREKRIEGTPFQ